LPAGGRPRWAWWAALVACAVLAAWQGWRGAAAGAGWALAVTLLLAVGLWLDARERRRERQRAHAKAALADQRASCERRMAACRDERERLTHERRAAEALLRELGAAEPLLQSWLAASQAAAEAAGQVDGLGASRAAMGDRWQAFLRHEVWAGAGSARPAADAGVALGPQAEAVQRFVQLSPASFVAEAKVVLEVREAEREAREQRHQAATHREWLARWVRAAEAAVAESAPAIPLSVTGRADSGEDLESRLAVVSEWLQRALAHARQQADRQRQRAAMDDELDLLARTIARQEEAVRRLRERLAGLYEALGARDGDAFDQLAARAAQRRRLLEACREQEARLHGQYGGRDLYESRQAVLDQADEAVLAQQVAHWEAECARLSREVTERTREVWALEQELSAWETRAGGLELRWQLARCRSERDRLAKRWAALVWAEALTRQARLTFERTRQPEALQVAAALFRHLTGNRYVALAVRTGSAGDAELVCVQADGREWSPARLSRGTREQLYLALRLALIHLYRRRGVDLPVVMDDPMVNFDGPRLAAALQVIAQEAEGGQVLYLTCRPELADLASQIDGVHVMYWPDAEA
ncbi:MAG: hypothetical protein IRZ33_07600, partial [Alicyclobacillaceae bacterium]|nr:hypothetical protein [Alicyclobacillaceae bacterium]